MLVQARAQQLQRPGLPGLTGCVLPSLQRLGSEASRPGSNGLQARSRFPSYAGAVLESRSVVNLRATAV
jgi:hypothetical protein